MVRFFALCSLVSAAFAAPATAGNTTAVETHGELPAGWVAVRPPSSQEETACANWADGWKVAGSGKDGVSLSPVERRQATFSLALDDGVMWATNRGEFGGKVEWQAAGSDKRVRIMAANPVAFMTFGNAVFVVEGLSHGPIVKSEGGTTFFGEYGQVDKLVRSDGAWKVDGKVKLDMAPETAMQSGEQAIILANRGVIAVNLRTMETSQLHRNDDWTMLSPNSIAPIGNDGYLIGLNSAVVRLTRSGATLGEQWWRPAACARMQPVANSKCPCLPEQ